MMPPVDWILEVYNVPWAAPVTVRKAPNRDVTVISSNGWSLAIDGIQMLELSKRYEKEMLERFTADWEWFETHPQQRAAIILPSGEWTMWRDHNYIRAEDPNGLKFLWSLQGFDGQEVVDHAHKTIREHEWDRIKIAEANYENEMEYWDNLGWDDDE